jgi:hypothetical protein
MSDCPARAAKQHAATSPFIPGVVSTKFAQVAFSWPVKASLADRGAPVGKTKRIDAKGVKDAKNDVCGYSIVQANSADEAARIFGKDQPFLQMPGATIDIIEIMEMPGT